MKTLYHGMSAEVQKDFDNTQQKEGDTMKTSEELRNEIWDYLLEYGHATEDEMRLVSKINGFTLESMESIIYAKTGYRNLEQLKDSDNE